MDHQQFSGINSTKLEQLFDLLISEATVSLQHAVQTVASSACEMNKMIEVLQDMGLSLQVKKNEIRRLNSVDKIDHQRIRDQLMIKSINKPVTYHFSTTSTNQLARECDQTGLFIAEYQGAGRGRLNRKWLTPIGQSIALSISHDFTVGLDQLAGLNIVVGVAIIKTAEYYGHRHLHLKWPNDVIGQAGKVAGILIEAMGNTQKSRVIIGIGINWNATQAILSTVEQDCMNIDINNCDRSDFIFRLIVILENLLNKFAHTQLQEIAPVWHQYDAFVGQWINVINDEVSRKAQYVGIDEHGMLKIAVDQKIKTLASGEVTIRKID